MRTLKHTILIMASAAMLWLVAACADKTDIPVPEPLPTTTNLVLDLRVNGTPASRAATAADRLPAGDWELIHTLRIIILAADGHVEHNGRYDLTAPAVQHTITIAVPNAEAKKIIFIANEDHFTVVDPTSRKSVSAAQYFNSLYATITPTEGNKITGDRWTALEDIAMLTADNPVFAATQLQDKKRIPVPAAAIYENVVIPRQPTYSRTFYLHRAAAKYTYRLTNNSTDGAVIINKARITHVAESQYLFYHGTYADSEQADLDTYAPMTLTNTQLTTKEYDVNYDVDFGKTVDIAPIYLPEGSIINPDSYKTNLQLNGQYVNPKTGGQNHVISVGANDDLNPGSFTAMTTLPRNTNVIINGSFSRESAAVLQLKYTICPWYETSTDIPPYN